jgi:hypothetical protein
MDWGDRLLLDHLSGWAVHFGECVELVSAVQSHLRHLREHRRKLHFGDLRPELFLPEQQLPRKLPQRLLRRLGFEKVHRLCHGMRDLLCLGDGRVHGLLRELLPANRGDQLRSGLQRRRISECGRKRLHEVRLGLRHLRLADGLSHVPKRQRHRLLFGRH